LEFGTAVLVSETGSLPIEEDKVEKEGDWADEGEKGDDLGGEGHDEDGVVDPEQRVCAPHQDKNEGRARVGRG
jgi:hypothetical protein